MPGRAVAYWYRNPDNCAVSRAYVVEYELHFLGAFVKSRKATIIFVMSVCLSVRVSAWNNSAVTERIFMKFDI
jgi:hypothetical protein